MTLLRNLILESLIIVRYAVFPTVLSLLLAFIDWHYGIIMSIIKLFIFLRLVHNEDKKTGSMQFRYILIKLFTAVTFYYFTDWAATQLQERYLPSGIYPKQTSTPTDGGVPTVKMTVPKSKAKKIFQAQHADDWQTRGTHVLTRILVHYLYMANSVAQYRWSFLATILIIYGLIYILVAYYLPSPRRRRSTGDSNQRNEMDDYDDSSDESEEDEE